MLSTKVSKLSGGEKRRLYLLTILMQNPNLLILDEPTNDLDIVTLNILEEYLLKFEGTLIIVSHDRHFLDRLVSHLFVFCGDGVLKDFIGSYTEYRSFLKDYLSEQKAKSAAAAPKPITPAKPERARKLSFKEKREMEALEAELAEIEGRLSALEALMNGGTAGYEELQAAAQEYQALKDEQDLKEMRWLELSEIGS